MTATLSAHDGRLHRATAWVLVDRRRTWWVVFALLSVLGGCWALATPLYAGPDEPAHTVRSAAVARGQFLGGEKPDDPVPGRLYVRVPGVYMSDNTNCIAFRPEAPASCQHFDNDAPANDMYTAAARHPVIYYLWAGLPSLILPTARGIYAMRMAGSVLAAAFVASAVLSLASLRDRRLGGLGLALALTPMVYFLMGLVSPSTPEIAAGIGVWTSGFVLVTQAEHGIDRRVLARFSAAACLLVLVRALGPFWLLLFAVALLLLGSKVGLGRLLRSKAVWVAAGIVITGTVLQLLWLALAKPFVGSDPAHAVDKPFTSLFRQALGHSHGGELQMIGIFGWLDTMAPHITYFIWAALVSLVALLGVAFAGRRQSLVLIGVIAAVVLVPALLDASQASSLGFIWQGRYTLPLAVGVPLLGACLAAGERSRRLFDRSRFYLVSGVLIVVAQEAAFYQALRRNSVGEAGALKFWSYSMWNPPVPTLLLLVVFPVVLSLLLVVLVGPGPAPTAVADGRGHEADAAIE